MTAEFFFELDTRHNLSQHQFARKRPVFDEGRLMFEPCGQTLPIQALSYAGQPLTAFLASGVLKLPGLLTTENAVSLNRLPTRDDIRQMERYYIVSDKEQVLSELHEHRYLCDLLLGAVPHLRQAFGESLLRLTVGADDEDSAVKVSVPWRGTLEAAEGCLRAFDDSWWLDNCAKSNGYLVFDIELLDGL